MNGETIWGLRNRAATLRLEADELEARALELAAAAHEREMAAARAKIRELQAIVDHVDGALT